MNPNCFQLVYLQKFLVKRFRTAFFLKYDSVIQNHSVATLFMSMWLFIFALYIWNSIHYPKKLTHSSSKQASWANWSVWCCLQMTIWPNKGMQEINWKLHRKLIVVVIGWCCWRMFHSTFSSFFDLQFL